MIIGDGGTSFYSPSRNPGHVCVRRVAPSRGSVLCFPHGDGVEGVGLIHEGSLVSSGVKYVIRTDVLYTK